MYVPQSIQVLKSALTLLLMILVSHNITGQFNIKVGYGLGFVSPEVNNQILADYNQSVSGNFDSYDAAQPLKLLYGVSLGAKYKLEQGSIEIDWQNMSRNIQSAGFILTPPPSNATVVESEYKYSFNMLMITYENNFGLLGLGSSIGTNVVNIKRVVGSNSASLFSDLHDNSQFFVRAHLSFNFSGNSTVAFAIKPFIQVPLSEIDLQPLATELGTTTTEQSESFPMFGLSFAFYNGRQ